MNKNYYSQSGQDSILEQFFNKKDIKNGFFVDIGSIDGIYYSNTYLLEKSGWKGICVEAHPTYSKMLVKNRPNSFCYEGAAGDEDKKECTFYANFLSSLSSLDETRDFSSYGWYYQRESGEKTVQGAVNGEVTVPMYNVDNLINKHKNSFNSIELITIDVDGSEKWVFKGLDLNKWHPRLLVLEHSVVPDLVHEYATTNGYHKGLVFGADTFYCRDEEDVEIISNIKPYEGETLSTVHPIDKL